MSRKNKIIALVCLLIIPVLIWYFCLKQSDYNITFKEKAASQTIFQGIDEWTKDRFKTNNEKYTTIQKSNFDLYKQELNINDTNYEYIWKTSPVNDSITAINVGISEKNKSFFNRISVPFFNTKFKIEQLSKITDFKKGLEDHLKNFRITNIGIGKSPETFVAYIKLKSVLQEKAQTMIGSDAVITGFLYRNKIKIIGKPYVQVENWNLENEQIEFNYCFPVDKNTKIVEDSLIKFKTIAAIDGLTASYFGNFRTSDRAWFKIMDYAKKYNYKIENKPLENFLANPFNGGTELSWETKIIIPFKK